MKKRKNTTKISTNALVSSKTVQAENLRYAAAELAEADISLVEITQALIDVRASHEAAIARKSKAETRLAKLRADLGVEVSS